MKQILTQQRSFFFQPSTILMRLFRPPAPVTSPPSKKKKEKEKCTWIFFSFSWDIFNTRETMETLIFKKLAGEQDKIWAM